MQIKKITLKRQLTTGRYILQCRTVKKHTKFRHECVKGKSYVHISREMATASLVLSGIHKQAGISQY
jgi:hypothetical protein